MLEYFLQIMEKIEYLSTHPKQNAKVTNNQLHFLSQLSSHILLYKNQLFFFMYH